MDDSQTNNKIVSDGSPTEGKPVALKKKKLKLNFVRTVNTDEIDQDWSYEMIITKLAPPTWEKLFSDVTEDIIHIDKLLKDVENIIPLKKDTFNAFYKCPLNKVKVIIVAQDPYHNLLPDGSYQANGLCFSTRKDCPIQPSLRNIYTELNRTIENFDIPDHGDLTEWANQGILLLNSSLTTEIGNPGCHGKIWMGVMTSVFSIIAQERPKTIVLLWGKHAQTLVPNLKGLKYLTSSHPSPMSVRYGFIGCDHFRQVNEHLTKEKLGSIDWKITS